MICAPLSTAIRLSFRKFNVITDLNGDLPSVSIEHFDGLPRFHSPPPSFVRGHMELVLLVDAAIAMKQVSHIVEVAIFNAEQGAADDVDVEFDRQFAEEFQILWREFRELSDGNTWTCRILQMTRAAW